MTTEIMTSLNVGQVIAIQGDQIRVKLTGEFLEEAQRRRVGQVGDYAIVDLGDTRLVGLITTLEVGEDSDGLGIMGLQLFGQITAGQFSRGLPEYPAIFDPVVLPEEEDLSAMLGAHEYEKREKTDGILLGRSAVNTTYPVYLSGEHFFSKHAAILGNTGSGKSCTIARIIAESAKSPQSQMILFDLHGEYRAAFTDANGELLPNVTYVGEKDLVLPYWLLRYKELEAILVDRSDPRLIANQNSFLKEALRRLRKPAAEKLGLLETYTVDTPIYYSLEQFKFYAENLNDARFVLNTDRYAFARSAFRNLEPAKQEEILLTQRAQFNRGNAEGETPHALYYQKLIGLIDRLEHKLNDCRYDFLLRPIEHARKSELFTKSFPEVLEDREDWSDMVEWLVCLLLGILDPRRNLTIIDLSGIPFDIIDLTVGLFTRVIFDYNFFSSAEDRRPVVFIYEEAHTYIPREHDAESFARVAVERVAKEGRKYGVSAVVVCQRPNELSHTVLSQCNNLVVMRLNNPEDQDYVTRVVSDQFADLVKMMPVLRPGECFVIGDSVPLPMRTLVELPPRVPASGNVDFLDAWSKNDEGEEPHSNIDRWFHQLGPNG